MTVLTQLNAAIHSDDDAGIIAACKLTKHTGNMESRIDETGVEWLEKLGGWLRSPENTSEIKSLKALAQSASANANEMRKAIQQFANVQSRTQMSMENRIFGAVERLRERMGNPDPASLEAKINAAGLQLLDLVLLSRDMERALGVYKAVVHTDNRSEEEIKRDVKDFRKLTLHWLSLEENKSPIKSLQAMVESADIASVKQVIGEFAAGNSPQESTKERVFPIALTLNRLTREAASVSTRMSSGTQSSPLVQGQGTKRRAPEEAGDNPMRRARRETNPGPTEDAVASGSALHQELLEELLSPEDAVASDTVRHQELLEEFQGVLAPPDNN